MILLTKKNSWRKPVRFHHVTRCHPRREAERPKTVEQMRDLLGYFENGIKSAQLLYFNYMEYGAKPTIDFIMGILKIYTRIIRVVIHIKL